MAAGLTLFSTASLFASKESSQARGGDHLGVIWSNSETQNVWRMPQQMNKIGNHLEFSRTGTGFGAAEGGFFLNKKDMASTFGVALPINFGLYFNNAQYEFDRVNNHDNLVNLTTDAQVNDSPARFDFFLGGFGDDYNLALRFGYNYVRDNASTSTAAEAKSASAVDFALGGTFEGFDAWVKFVLEPSSDNTTYKNNSLASAWQIGVRKELAGFRVYAEYNDGLQSHLGGAAIATTYNLYKDNSTNSNFQLGVARVHRIKDNGQFFWDARFTYTDLSKNIVRYRNHTRNSHDVKGWDISWTAGLAHEVFSWLRLAGSLEHTLYNGLDKPNDALKRTAMANLGFRIHSGGLGLDLNSSFTGTMGDGEGLSEILKSTTATLTYDF